MSNSPPDSTDVLKWPKRTFAELIAEGVLEIGDGYRARLEELGGDGPIFLRAGHVCDTHIDFDSVDRFKSGVAPGIRSKMSEPGDVVITTKGNSTGRVGFVDHSMPRFVYSPHLSYWRSLMRDSLDPGYLRYWSHGLEFQQQLRGLSTSTDMAPYLSLVDQKRLSITLPCIAVQRSVATVLGSLDDKIELNRRMNETLEAMARALFKDWFIDFGPVRAKMEDRQPPGLAPEIAALFPDRLDEEGKPEGWTSTTLGELAIRYGGRVQTGPFGSQLHASDYVNDGVPVVMPKDLERRRVATSSIARVREEDAQRLARHRLQEGDIIYSRRGDVEQHALIGKREVGWLCGTGCLLVRLGSAFPCPLYVSLALDSPETREWIVRHAVGATMPNLNTGILSSVPMLFPEERLIAAFEEVTQGLSKMISVNDAQTEELAELRDNLLPKLLSGSLRVNGAQGAVEGVA